MHAAEPRRKPHPLCASRDGREGGRKRLFHEGEDRSAPAVGSESPSRNSALPNANFFSSPDILTVARSVDIPPCRLSIAQKDPTCQKRDDLLRPPRRVMRYRRYRRKRKREREREREGGGERGGEMERKSTRFVLERRFHYVLRSRL